MTFDYDGWKERAYQKKIERDKEFEYLIRYIKERNLHEDPDSLNLYQAREIVQEHEAELL